MSLCKDVPPTIPAASKDQWELDLSSEIQSVVLRSGAGVFNGAVPVIKAFDIEYCKFPGRLIYPALPASGGIILRYPVVLYSVINASGGSLNLQIQVVKGDDLDDADTWVTIATINANEFYTPAGGHHVLPANSIVRVTGGAANGSVELMMKRAKSMVST